MPDSQYFPMWATSEIKKGNIMEIVIAEKTDVEEVSMHPRG